MKYRCIYSIIVHKKQAKLTKNRAPMIRSCSSKQLTLTEFYYQGLSAEKGRPAKDARLVLSDVYNGKKIVMLFLDLMSQHHL